MTQLDFRMGHMIQAEPSVPRVLAKFFLSSILKQFERDIPIWTTKTFVTKPLVVKGDGKYCLLAVCLFVSFPPSLSDCLSSSGPLLQYRRWVQQFFEEEQSTETKEKNEKKDTTW